MPGLIGSQGVRPGALNMNRVFRALRYRTEQAQFVTYHRPAIYDTDDYGVPTGTSAAVPELLLPDLPAIIRPRVTADYSQERAGNNIIGAARIYTPNITTIKNYTNFDQDNNTNFNEIEGWDRLITNYRTVYSVPTDVTGSWTTDSGSITTDGESITNTLTGNPTMTFTGVDVNTLEADRITFKLKGSGSVSYKHLYVYNSGTATTSALSYRTSFLSPIVLVDNAWLTIDLPWTTDIVESGATAASGTSIYQTGTRTNIEVEAGDTYDYTKNLRQVKLLFGGTSGDTIQIKDIKFYKSLEWSVHSVKELNDDFNVFNVVRTAGRIDSRRRADAS